MEKAFNLLILLFLFNSVTYSQNNWALVMSNGTEYSSQTWKTNAYFPKDAIKEGWDNGKKITSLSYGDGMWALVMSNGTEYSSQTWKTNAYFPKDAIKEGWDSGKKITTIIFSINKK